MTTKSILLSKLNRDCANVMSLNDGDLCIDREAIVDLRTIDGRRRSREAE